MAFGVRIIEGRWITGTNAHLHTHAAHVQLQLQLRRHLSSVFATNLRISVISLNSRSLAFRLASAAVHCNNNNNNPRHKNNKQQQSRQEEQQ